MVWELIKNILSCSAQNTSYRTIPFPISFICILFTEQKTRGNQITNLQKEWKAGPDLLLVVRKCSVKTWNSFPIFCVLPWSLNSTLSHTPDVQLYLGTTGCNKYGISALLLLLCFKSNPYSDFNLGFFLFFVCFVGWERSGEFTVQL